MKELVDKTYGVTPASGPGAHAAGSPLRRPAVMTRRPRGYFAGVVTGAIAMGVAVMIGALVLSWLADWLL